MAERVAALKKVIPRGVVATDLSKLAALVAVPKVRDRIATFDQPQPDQVSAAVREVIFEAIEQLSGQERRRAEMLMGVGAYQGEDHRTRRSEFARTYGPHFGWDEVRQRQGEHVLREIAALMVGARPPQNERSLERGYADWTENQYWVDARGVITLLQCRRRVRALRDGVQTATFLHQYYADTRREVLSVSRVWGAQLVSEEWLDKGFLRLHLGMGDELSAGEERVFGYEVTVTTDVPASKLVQADESSEESVLRCVFDPGLKPGTVWSFQNLARQDAPGKPEAGQAIALDSSGMASRAFGPVVTGKASGIGWLWPHS